MKLPENAPKWLTLEMLTRVGQDSTTALARDLRRGASHLSPQALSELELCFPRESGAAARSRQQRLDAIAETEAELDRQRAELDRQRDALTPPTGGDHR